MDRWVIAYDLDISSIEAANAAGGVSTATVYNRIKACLRDHGIADHTQHSIYAMEDGENALARLFQALQALGKLDERKFIKRLHVFKIDGAINDVLPIVAGKSSATPDP